MWSHAELLGCLQGGFGATAVKCGGTGALQCVRVIHLSKDTLFWFDVHAGKPGLVNHATPTDSRSAHLLTQPRSDANIEKVVAQQAGQQQQLTHVQAQAASAPEFSSSADEEGVMIRRVKAWEATHHPVLPAAQAGAA